MRPARDDLPGAAGEIGEDDFDLRVGRRKTSEFCVASPAVTLLRRVLVPSKRGFSATIPPPTTSMPTLSIGKLLADIGGTTAKSRSRGLLVMVMPATRALLKGAWLTTKPSRMVVRVPAVNLSPVAWVLRKVVRAAVRAQVFVGPDEVTAQRPSRVTPAGMVMSSV